MGNEQHKCCKMYYYYRISIIQSLLLYCVTVKPKRLLDKGFHDSTTSLEKCLIKMYLTCNIIKCTVTH